VDSITPEEFFLVNLSRFKQFIEPPGTAIDGAKRRLRKIANFLVRRYKSLRMGLSDNEDSNSFGVITSPVWTVRRDTKIISFNRP
jgi:hypothetical protein